MLIPWCRRRWSRIWKRSLELFRLFQVCLIQSASWYILLIEWTVNMSHSIHLYISQAYNWNIFSLCWLLFVFLDGKKRVVGDQPVTMNVCEAANVPVYGCVVIYKTLETLITALYRGGKSLLFIFSKHSSTHTHTQLRFHTVTKTWLISKCQSESHSIGPAFDTLPFMCNDW